jgi:hypothetical protein
MKSTKYKVYNRIYSQLWNQFSSKQTYNRSKLQISDRIINQVDDLAWQQIYDQIKDQVNDQIWFQ